MCTFYSLSIWCQNWKWRIRSKNGEIPARCLCGNVGNLDNASWSQFLTVSEILKVRSHQPAHHVLIPTKTIVVGLTAVAHDQNAHFRLGNPGISGSGIRKMLPRVNFWPFQNFEGSFLSTSALRYQKCKNERHRTDGCSARSKRTFPARKSPEMPLQVNFWPFRKFRRFDPVN